MDGFVHMRKAHCMFGWDWGAHLPDAGIFREVSLLGVKGARIDSVYIRQEHEEGKCTLQIEVEERDAVSYSLHGAGETERTAPEKRYYTVEITAPDGAVCQYTDSPREITVERPMLWWPNGYGEQPLYTVKVELFLGGEHLDVWEKRIGLRRMTVRAEKDEWGRALPTR
mgnify:FL=1